MPLSALDYSAPAMDIALAKMVLAIAILLLKKIRADG